jgi:hypothetical protein
MRNQALVVQFWGIVDCIGLIVHEEGDLHT